MTLVVQSAVVSSAGYITVAFFNSDAGGVNPVSREVEVSGLQFTIDGVDLDIFGSMYADGTNDQSINFFLSRPVYEDEVVTLSATSSNLMDSLSVSLSDVSDFPATNNSGQINPGVQSSSADVLENITLNIVSTLEGITTGNGFQNTVNTVDRPRPGQKKNWQNLDLMVDLDDDDPILPSDQLSSEFRQRFNVYAFVREPESSSTPIDARINSIRADIIKALMGTPGRRGRGGLALTTEIQGEDRLIPSATAKEGAITIQFIAQFATVYGDPYTSAYV